MSPAYDENLVLHDGTTITADISPVSLTRTSGSAVIDLRKTPVKGLYAMMFLDEDLAEADDTLDITIEESDTLASGWVEIARFPQVTSAATADRMSSLSFITAKRYVRAKIDVTDADAGGDFSVANCRVLIGTSPITD